MPTVEGQLRTGWLVLFTKEETETALDAVGAVGIAAGLVPEPTASKVLAAAAGLVVIAAKVARRRGLALGVLLGLASANPVVPQPFLYNENDTASLEEYRELVRSDKFSSRSIRELVRLDKLNSRSVRELVRLDKLSDRSLRELMGLDKLNSRSVRELVRLDKVSDRSLRELVQLDQLSGRSVGKRLRAAVEEIRGPG
jgi:hypothetical protein